MNLCHDEVPKCSCARTLHAGASCIPAVCSLRYRTKRPRHAVHHLPCHGSRKDTAIGVITELPEEQIFAIEFVQRFLQRLARCCIFRTPLLLSLALPNSPPVRHCCDAVLVPD